MSTAVPELKAPFPYFGGKSVVAPLVWARLGDVANFVEPFFGSGACLLGRPHLPRTETVNDADGYLANFWRAVQTAPEAVARYADWPVNECDLHARHLWLVNEGRRYAPASGAVGGAWETRPGWPFSPTSNRAPPPAGANEDEKEKDANRNPTPPHPPGLPALHPRRGRPARIPARHRFRGTGLPPLRRRGVSEADQGWLGDFGVGSGAAARADGGGGAMKGHTDLLIERARELLGLDETWHWCRLEMLPRDRKPSEPATAVFVELGQMDCEKCGKFRKPFHSIHLTLREEAANADQWSERTGKCSKCMGTGQVVAGISAEGTRWRDCARCEGTGAAEAVELVEATRC